MALTFPLSVQAFFATLPIGAITFDAPEQVEISQTGGGEVISAETGPMLWTGEVTMGRLTSAEAAGVEVLIDVLRPSGRFFYAYDVRRPYPAADPLGTLLGAATPTIHTLPAGNRELRLAGLPVGYVLSRGDYLAFDYAGRRALHRVVAASVAADAGGITPVFEVHPLIRPGAVVGAAVTLVRAACKARLLPGSISKGASRRTITEGISFRLQQTLK